MVSAPGRTCIARAVRPRDLRRERRGSRDEGAMEEFQLVAAGIQPQAPPRDAEWGERFFHVTDPDGHEISFAWPLKR